MSSPDSEITDPELLELLKRKRSSHVRRLILARQIELVPGNRTMPACSECVAHDRECYYDAERATKCAGCIRHQRECDGSFSVLELRKVSEQKKIVEAKSRRKRREMLKLRRSLTEARRAVKEAQDRLMSAELEFAELENEDCVLQDSLEQLDGKIESMLRREMRALGVLNEQPADQEVALADPNLWSSLPLTEIVDWSDFPGFSGSGSGQGSPCLVGQ